MEPDGDSWEASVTPSAPGAWKVTVEVTGLVGQAAPRVQDVLGVIDPMPSPGGERGSV
jgi:hypothetical protein